MLPTWILILLTVRIYGLIYISVWGLFQDPSKFAVAAAPVDASASGASAPAAAVEEKKEEPPEESDDDLGFSLFD